MYENNETASISIARSYDQYFEMVYRVSYSYLKNSTDAEDATADVFVKLLRRNKGFQSAEHEKAWLIRATISVAKDYLKHWWRNRANIDDYESLHGDDPYNIDETLKTVMELPTRYKDVIYLYYYGGC